MTQTVCIDCRYLGTRPSGIAELVKGLIDHAPRLAPDILFVLLKNPDFSGPLANGPNIIEQKVRVGPNSPASMWLLPRITSLRGAGVFHSPSNTLPAGLKMRTVTTIHDIMWLTNPALCDITWPGKIKQAFFAHGIRRAIANSDRLASVSQSTLDDILKFSPGAHDRLRLTQSGVAKRFRPAKRDPKILQRFGVVDHQKYALVVGQFAPYKNHHRALEAFAEALPNDAGAKLIFVQRRGQRADPLRRLAAKLQISGRVHFASARSEDELIQLYSHASALLHPSLCEGFGNPVAEAMACGCPVITSNQSAMPEVSGGAALLVDPFNIANIAAALRLIWYDKEKARAMREAGLARATELSWEDFAKKNIAIYRELLAS